MKKHVLFNKFDSCKRPLLVFLLTILTCYTAFAQNRQVTGKVTSADKGAGLPGVSIRVKGTSAGVVTDAGGSYKISAPANATLVFSYVGYASQDVTVGDGSVYNVKMVSSVNNLSEVVVVSIGYGTAKRKDVTGAISSVTAEQIAKVPVTSVDQALQGRAAGVQVTNNDGAPGNSVSVVIRGVGSLSNNDPLYVVDGYPISGGLNTINPNDIASIDILKDASATAIYGVRAAGGVVIITTKRGKRDGLQVSLDAYGSLQTKPKMYKVLNAEQWATLANEDHATEGFSELPEWSNPAALRNVDWQNAVYKQGYKQNYNLAIRGGNEKVQTSFSAGYYDQQGIVLGSYFKRLNLAMNIDYTVNKWLKSSTSAKFAREDTKNPFGTGPLSQLSELIPTITGNKLTDQIKDANGNYGFYNPINTYTKSWNNPVYTIETTDAKNLSNNFLSNSSLEATIIDGLKIKTNFGLNVSDFSGYYFTPQDDRSSEQYNLNSPAVSFYSQNASNTYEWLWENTISYNKVFGKHAIDFVGGVSQQSTTYRNVGGQGDKLPSNAIRDLSQVQDLTAYGGQTVQTLASEFARLSYKFDDRYIVTGTVRRDGSSKFDTDHQYGVFPSGAVAWRAKQESFLKDVNFLSDLKFRGSYGEVGNQAGIPPFKYLAQYTSGGPASSATNVGYPFNKIYQGGLALTQLENPNLKWETDRLTDIGMDVAFLRGDLTFTVDYYKKISKDFLLVVPTATQTGFANQTENLGSISNKGFEFAANYNHSTSSGLRYGFGLSITTVNNELLSINKSTTYIQNLVTLPLNASGWNPFSQTNIGQPIGEFFGYKSLGIFQNQAQINALNAKSPRGYYQGTTGQPTQPGDRYFADVNGDGQIDASDRTSLGSPIPKFYGGLNFDLSYKAFDFNAYFYGSYGNKIFNYQERNLESFQAPGFVGVENVSEQYYLNRWTPTNPSNRFARVTYNDDVSANNVPSSVYVENGSYLRLRNITVGYTLPASLVKKVSITKVRFYVSAQNLFTITKYTGLDPEIGNATGTDPNNNNAAASGPTAAGVDAGTYPSSRFFTLGLNVTF
jgi:TonB-linked SusC/RagA family outer membrane protein